MCFENDNARGGIKHGAFRLTNKSCAFSLTRRTQQARAAPQHSRLPR